MKRWWDDPDYARGALERVDGSDVAQGVGTAVLGYHALAKGMLADLPGSTLVDPALVWSRLEQLDLQPVAKALASATAPLMGEASVRYGELLAADVHEQSLAGLETLMAQMGATGLPMPMIVERAVEVVGVPARHMGGYAKIAKAPVVGPVVKADAADRALMLYASHLGAREATGAVPVPDEEVSKINVRFREEEHPRDGDGQFATKEADPRKDRAERRARRQVRAERAVSADAQERAQALSQASSLVDMARALAPREQVREQVRDKPRTSLREIARAVMHAEPVAAPAAPEVQALPAPPKVTTHFALTEHLPRKLGEHVTVLDTTTIGHREQSVIVPMDVAEQIATAGGFTTGVLEMMYGGQIGDLHLFSADSPSNDVWDWASVNGITSNIDLVVLTFEGPLPVRAGDYDDDQGIQLATDSRWELTNAGDQEEWVVPRDPMGPLGKPDEVLPVLRFSNANAGDYENDQKIIKAHAEKWEGRGIVLVSRNPDGEFATEDHAEVHLPEKPPDVARRERAARRARRSERALHAVQSAPAEPAAAASPRAAARARAFAPRERLVVRDRAGRAFAPREAVLDRTAVQASAEAAMLSQRGMVLDSREFSVMFDRDIYDLEDVGSQRVEVTPRNMRDKVPAIGDPLTLLHNWSTRGLTSTGQKGRVGLSRQSYDTWSEAQEHADRLNRAQAGSLSIWSPVEALEGEAGFKLLKNDYGTAPTIMVYGDPELIKRVHRGNVSVVLELERGVDGTDAFEREHGLVWGASGENDAPILAVRVRSLDDVSSDEPYRAAERRQVEAERGEANEIKRPRRTRG